MKKKFLMTAAACALSAACIFGATACNKDNGDDKSGVPDVGASIQVADEAAWNAALMLPRNATTSTFVKIVNSTEDVAQTSTITVIGYVVGNEDYKQTTTVTDNKKSVSYDYSLLEENAAHAISYNAHREGDSDSWSVFDASAGGSAAGDILCSVYPYSAFQFKDGVYTGKITDEGLGGTGTKAEVTVTIKIGSDGYLKYMKSESNADGTYILNETAIYNINSTTYTFPADAKQAIADYKAANS